MADDDTKDPGTPPTPPIRELLGVDGNGVDPAAATDQAAQPQRPNGRPAAPVVIPITPEDQRRLNQRGGKCMAAALVMNPGYGGGATHCTIIQQPGGGRVEVYNLLLVRDQDGQAKLERFIFMDESKIVRVS